MIDRTCRLTLTYTTYIAAIAALRLAEHREMSVRHNWRQARQALQRAMLEDISAELARLRTVENPTPRMPA